jgi:hypothetical protein
MQWTPASMEVDKCCEVFPVLRGVIMGKPVVLECRNCGHFMESREATLNDCVYPQKILCELALEWNKAKRKGKET